MEALYLKPGESISKKGLPNGRIECKKNDEPLKLGDNILKVIEKNIPFLKTKGTLLDQSAYEKFITVEETDSEKSEKRLALEKEATELEIEFTDSTTQKELKALIAEKTKELEE